jgi:acyl-CoA thioesterase FadM
VECDYLGAIHYDDLLRVEVSVSKVGHSAFRLQFDVKKEQTLVARGNFVIVSMDRASGRPVQLPERLAGPLRGQLKG